MKNCIVGLILLCLLAGCQPSSPKAENEPTDKQAEHQDAPLEHLGSMSALSEGTYAGKQGYYFIVMKDSNDGELYYSIHFIDYETKKEVVLCNKPNCTHKDASCPAFIEFGTGYANYLFSDEEHLYLLHGEMGGEENEQGGGALASSNIATTFSFYRMNMDGTERTKIASLDAGVDLQSNGFRKGHDVYLILDQMQPDRSIKKTMIRFDGTTGSQETLLDMTDKSVIGIHENALVIAQSDFYAKRYSAEDDVQTIINDLANAQGTLFLYDVASKQRREVTKGGLNTFDGAVVLEDGLYIQNESKDQLLRLSLEDGQKEVVAQGLHGGYISALDPTHIMFTFDDGAAVNASITDAEIFDSRTKELTKLKLWTSEPRQPVQILAAYKDQFLVISDVMSQTEYMEYFDVTQTNITGYVISLISQSDFYAGNATYTPIARVSES